MKTLIVAEKSSAAEDFVEGLKIYGKFNRKGRSYESDNYVITWVQGHLIGLKETGDYANWGKKWLLEALPWYPPEMKFELKVKEENKHIFQEVSAIMQRKDIELIVSATDAGREGDLIFWEMYDYLKLKTPVKRFYESAVMTPENIQRIMKNDLKGPDFYEPMKKAAYSRAYADLLLGMNFTIGFTAKANTKLNLGRVKTPTLAVIANRRKEIDNFVKEQYFELKANFGETYDGIWFKDQLGNTKIEKREDAEAIENKIKNKIGKIIKKDVEEKKQGHQLLYSLTSLQREANKKFGFDPNETLNIAQSLYDTHKILSYPRTDSEVIGEAHVAQLKGILETIEQVDAYKEFARFALDAGIPTSKRIVNDKKLTDHHALLPTNVKPNLEKLNANEKKIFDLVVKRFLSVFYPPAVYEKTSVITEVETETFKTTGTVEKEKGWKVVYQGIDLDDDDEKEDVLPPMEKDETRMVVEVELKDKWTSPPSLHTMDTLLGVMEKPKKMLQTKEMQDSFNELEEELENEVGLGTTATRANIIASLEKGGYIQKVKKAVDVTSLGAKLIDICPEDLKSPLITAEWERKLMDMSKGKFTQDAFMNGITEYIEENLDILKNTPLTVSFDSERGASGNTGEEVCACRHCGKPVRDKSNFYACDTNTKENPCFIFAKEIGKKKITATHIKQLMSDGQSKMIEGFVSAKGNKFDAALKFDGKEVKFSFDAEAIGKCRQCGTEVKSKGQFYTCESHTKENPCFIVWKEIAKKKITDSIVKQLLEKGETNEIKGFTGQKGKFDAKLKINGNKVEFSFNNKPKVENKKTDLVCSQCKKGHIQENAKAFGCTNWQGGCKFTVWKNGKAITLEIVEQIVKDGISEKVKGIESPKGKFDAKLTWNAEKQKIEYIFD